MRIHIKQRIIAFTNVLRVRAVFADKQKKELRCRNS